MGQITRETLISHRDELIQKRDELWNELQQINGAIRALDILIEEVEQAEATETDESEVNNDHISQ